MLRDDLLRAKVTYIESDLHKTHLVVKGTRLTQTRTHLSVPASILSIVKSSLPLNKLMPTVNKSHVLIANINGAVEGTNETF